MRIRRGFLLRRRGRGRRVSGGGVPTAEPVARPMPPAVIPEIDIFPTHRMMLSLVSACVSSALLMGLISAYAARNLRNTDGRSLSMQAFWSNVASVVLGFPVLFIAACSLAGVVKRANRVELSPWTRSFNTGLTHAIFMSAIMTVGPRCSVSLLRQIDAGRMLFPDLSPKVALNISMNVMSALVSAVTTLVFLWCFMFRQRGQEVVAERAGGHVDEVAGGAAVPARVPEAAAEVVPPSAGTHVPGVGVWARAVSVSSDADGSPVYEVDVLSSEIANKAS